MIKQVGQTRGHGNPILIDMGISFPGLTEKVQAVVASSTGTGGGSPFQDQNPQQRFVDIFRVTAGVCNLYSGAREQMDPVE